MTKNRKMIKRKKIKMTAKQKMIQVIEIKTIAKMTNQIRIKRKSQKIRTKKTQKIRLLHQNLENQPVLLPRN
jgi:hypothetical protein